MDSFNLFRSFHDKYSTNLTLDEKSVDGVLGTQTRGSRMVGAVKSTELWQHPYNSHLCMFVFQRNFVDI